MVEKLIIIQNTELIKLYKWSSDNIPFLYRNLIKNCWNEILFKRFGLSKFEETVQHLKNSEYKNKNISLDYKKGERKSKPL
ncbi:hypothetical protein H8356DRAFT_1678886, partial [Neocallimastix lanati (nom. inval.)]